MKTLGAIIGKRGGDYCVLESHRSFPKVVLEKSIGLHRGFRWKPIAIDEAELSVLGGLHYAEGTILLRISSQGDDSIGRSLLVFMEVLWIENSVLDLSVASKDAWPEATIDTSAMIELNVDSYLKDPEEKNVQDGAVWLDRPSLLHSNGALPSSDIGEVNLPSAGIRFEPKRSLSQSRRDAPRSSAAMLALMLICGLVGGASAVYFWHKPEIEDWRDLALEFDRTGTVESTRRMWHQSSNDLSAWQTQMRKLLGKRTPKSAAEEIKRRDQNFREKLNNWQKAASIGGSNEVFDHEGLRTRLSDMVATIDRLKSNEKPTSVQISELNRKIEAKRIEANRLGQKLRVLQATLNKIVEEIDSP